MLPREKIMALIGKETSINVIQLEVLLDMRDQNTEIISLLQKLVEKSSKTKVISTTVPMSEKEQALLDAIEL